MAAVPFPVVGLFEGVHVAGTSAQQKKWLIRALPQQPGVTQPYMIGSAGIPTLYGAVLTEDGAVAGFVRGAHSPQDDGALVLYETVLYDSITPKRIVDIHYTAESENRVVLKGRYEDGSGSVTMACDTDLAETPLAVNLYCGMAVPHPDLADFMIPINPIEWVVLERRRLDGKPTTGAPAIISGVGYFVSGDEAGQPTLLYSIVPESDAAPGQPAGLCRISKVYEPVESTAGFTVDYAAAAVVVNGKPGLAGTWVNEKGQSRGYFSCVAQELRPGASVTGTTCGMLGMRCPPGTLMIQRENGECVSFDAMAGEAEEATVDLAKRIEVDPSCATEPQMQPFSMMALSYAEQPEASADEGPAKPE